MPIEVVKKHRLVRWMIRKDFTAVQTIDVLTDPEPWNLEDGVSWFEGKSNIAMVVEEGEQVVGWMAYTLFSDHLQLVRFAIHPAWQGKGFAGELMQRLFAKMSSHRRNKIVADVRETNLNGLNFLKRYGFRAVRIMRDWFYSEDAVFMEYELEQ